MVSSSASPTEHYVSTFRRQAREARKGPAWLGRLRESAIEEFKQLGFPGPKDEDWRYTSLEPITATRFEPANGRGGRVGAPEALLRSAFTEPVSNRLVFVDGRFAPEFSSLDALKKGVTVTSLAEAADGHGEVVRRHLGRYTGPRKQGFAALNTAFVEDGALVHMARGCALEEPLYLIFLSTGSDRPTMMHPRNLLVFETQSQARVVECYVGADGSAYWNNSVTEIALGEGAHVEHYRLQREAARGIQVGAIYASLGRNAALTAHAVTIGGALIRNDVYVVLDGEGAECVLNGLYLVDSGQHVDNHTEIDHAQPHGTSSELYKGILTGDGRAVFNGKIVVRKDAQKTDARQTNKNLLLSERASVNTKPQLEIHANDVKCSHGSTIGQLDRDALFYLRSRGLDFKQARSLLSYGFASDVVGRMKVAPVRARLDDFILSKFGAGEQVLR